MQKNNFLLKTVKIPKCPTMGRAHTHTRAHAHRRVCARVCAQGWQPGRATPILPPLLWVTWMLPVLMPLAFSLTPSFNEWAFIMRPAAKPMAPAGGAPPSAPPSCCWPSTYCCPSAMPSCCCCCISPPSGAAPPNAFSKERTTGGWTHSRTHRWLGAVYLCVVLCLRGSFAHCWCLGVCVYVCVWALT